MFRKTIIDFKPLKKRLLFTNPVVILKTRKIEEVSRILDTVENYQKKGYYVVGYLSYEAAKAFDINYKVKDNVLLTEYLAFFTVHDRVIEEEFPQSYEDVDISGDWMSETSQEEYRKAIETIKHHIRQGDTYQVNYTIQLTNKLEVPAEQIYHKMVIEQGATYNAYIETDDFQVISFSPELFFEKKGQQLMTRPMKGTTKRGLSIELDRKQKDWLKADAKNRAENMMIVDLLRNDMSRVSEVGTVKVASLCDVEPYSTVWQMTSTITSHISQNTSLFELLQALFPCGSITGAPKIETMSIIDKIEPKARGVYCGTIGLMLPNGDLLFNVAIRTIQLSGTNAIYGVGGGITWYSSWEDEYEETRQKSHVLYRQKQDFDLITTGRVENGQLQFYQAHIDRLKIASDYFVFSFDSSLFEKNLQKELASLDLSKIYRCQIRLAKNGRFSFNIEVLEDLPESFYKASLVRRRHNVGSPFYFFKTSLREHIPKRSHELIFMSKDGELQETQIGNLILEKDGKWYTPPLSVGIVDGIYRQYLLDQGRLIEKNLTEDDLQIADNVYACNCVRGVYPLEWSRDDGRRSD